MGYTRANDVLEFLPAVLEVEETPPLPASRWILWSIMIFLTVTVAWAGLGEMDIVAVAQGKIIPGGKVKLIQPLEPGVVRAILIQEGDDVVAGQPLLELDATLTGADQASIGEQLLALELNRARLLSLLAHIKEAGAGGQGVAVDARSLNIDPFLEVTGATPEQRRQQQERARSELQEYLANVAALEQDVQERQAEQDAVQQRITRLDATIPLISERARSLGELVSKNMAPRMQWLELEQERIEQVQERDVQDHISQSLTAAIAGLTQRLAATRAEYETKLRTELTDAENRLAALVQERIKSEKRVTLQTLTAPVAGRVHQLTVHTVGGVVTPAQELMHIVPESAAIEVEAWLPNKDIGFVEDGQRAVLKIETFPFTQYGTIDGEVMYVSSDATPDERLGLVYAMRVRMQRTTMRVKHKVVNLVPGMAVTVEVNTGQRRLIEFLLSPLLKYKDEAARER